MSQQGEPASKPHRRIQQLMVGLGSVALSIGFALGGRGLIAVGSAAQTTPWSATDAWLVFGGGGLFLLGFAAIVASVPRDRLSATEAQARERVRKAEDNLGDALRTPSPTGRIVYRRSYLRSNGTRVAAHWVKLPNFEQVYADEADEELLDRASLEGADDADDEEEDEEDEVEQRLGNEQVSAGRQEERLTLAALWNVTHSRLDLYHEIVTGQARRSFRSAQAAMWVGFIILIAFAVIAAQAKTTAGAISVGSLGAVGAAFAAFIGRTFVRSQESAANHLRAYFDQPLELSRYLAAERLLADDARLNDDQHAAAFSTLVQSIATASHPVTSNGTSSMDTRRRSTGQRGSKRPCGTDA